MVNTQNKLVGRLCATLTSAHYKIFFTRESDSSSLICLYENNIVISFTEQPASVNDVSGLATSSSYPDQVTGLFALPLLMSRYKSEAAVKRSSLPPDR
ncbi:hypothetical protein RRG08_046509 [Elysia crispata]|uniref:Uncharacterized protein n=1 Tax=Elysia crispata TaxID=231223 RepID=A0AAE1DAZ5_9GAST|nr:hypothetical protein RRG08_046509 [Elysia crispata]